MRDVTLWVMNAHLSAVTWMISSLQENVCTVMYTRVVCLRIFSLLDVLCDLVTVFVWCIISLLRVFTSCWCPSHMKRAKIEKGKNNRAVICSSKPRWIFKASHLVVWCLCFSSNSLHSWSRCLGGMRCSMCYLWSQSYTQIKTLILLFTPQICVQVKSVLHNRILRSHHLTSFIHTHAL